MLQAQLSKENHQSFVLMGNCIFNSGQILQHFSFFPHGKVFFSDCKKKKNHTISFYIELRKIIHMKENHFIINVSYLLFSIYVETMTWCHLWPLFLSWLPTVSEPTSCVCPEPKRSPLFKLNEWRNE